ncbi:armadillo-type protein [Mucidula mucida]|nr:armadillo-type protein [Mucidula mucida]
MNTGSGRPMAMGVTVDNVSPQELYQALEGATSQDPRVLHQSDKRLKQMLGLFGAFDALQDIAAERSVPLPVRQQAIIQFKNEALKSWKSRKLQNDEHRGRIRERCLSFLDEEDQTIADCNALIVAKLARQDYPLAWSNLVTVLMNTIDTNLQLRYSTPSEDLRPTLLLQRSLQLLNGVLREFAAYKMLTGVKTMTQLVDSLHAVLYSYYATMAATFANVDVDAMNTSRVYFDVSLAHQVYKCISRIGIWLWQRGEKMGLQEKEPWFVQFFQDSAVQVKALLQLRHTLLTTSPAETPQSRAFIEVLTKHIRHIGKFFRRLSQLSHARFVELPGCSELVMFYWNHVAQALTGPSETVQAFYRLPIILYPVRILVQGMVLFNENLAQWVPVKRDGMPNKNALSSAFVEEAVKIIVTRLLPLNVQDLQAWMADPEEWVNAEDKENDQWEYELRACSERVLIHMSNQFPEYVVPLLRQAAPDFQTLLQKEALYCAIGRCAGRLHETLPFEQWASQTLVTEAQSTDSNYPIIKRRIAWLIGKWSQIVLNPNMPVAWQIIMHLMSDRGPGTDTVVRLTAAMALRECVDTIDFNIDAFQQWLSMAVTELVKLMGEADTLENKRRVDSTLNALIEQAGQRISPLVDTITQPLPGIWTDAGEDFLLKASLLVTVTNLVNATKGESSRLTHIVVPLVQESLQQAIHLDEDGLALWKAALRNLSGTAAVQPFMDLFPEAIRLLGTNLDLLSQVVDIVDSYFLLAGPQILQVCAVPLFVAFYEALRNVSVTSNLKDMVICINNIVGTNPSSLWGEALHVSGLFAYLMTTLLDSEVVTFVLIEHIYVFARIVMADRAMFAQLMTHTAPALKITEAKLYELLMDAWWTKFDSMSEGKHRKLCAMGVAALVSTGRPEVLERLPTEILTYGWTSLGKSRKPPSAESPLRRHWELEDAPYAYFKESQNTPEYDRRKMLYDNDPVRTIKLSTYVGERLREAEAIYGSSVFRGQFLSKADPTVLQQIEKELTL